MSFGSTRKKFDDATRTDADLEVWAMSFVWQPKDSKIVVQASSGPRETYNTGDFLEVRDVSLALAHQFSERFGTNLYARTGQSTHAEDTRTDDLTNYGAAFTWHAKRWLGVRLFVDQSDRQSNVNTFDYRKTVWGITLDMSV